MSALIVALMLSQAADAPVAESEPRPAMILTAGSIVPFDGVCLDDAQTVKQAKRVASCEASMSLVETKTMVSTPVLVGGIVAIVAVAFAAGAATAYAVKK